MAQGAGMLSEMRSCIYYIYKARNCMIFTRELNSNINRLSRILVTANDVEICYIRSENESNIVIYIICTYLRVILGLLLSSQLKRAHIKHY